jgi:hypothetical protein
MERTGTHRLTTVASELAELRQAARRAVEATDIYLECLRHPGATPNLCQEHAHRMDHALQVLADLTGHQRREA